jgi:hypothetical protein
MGFFSNIKNLSQCELYGAAGNPQEITVLKKKKKILTTSNDVGLLCP